MNLIDLQAILDGLLRVSLFAGLDDQNGVYLPSGRPVRRLGLALEPFPDLVAWITTERLDALFLHRPWRLTDGQREYLLTHEIGVLAYHLAFDERLTTGFNPALAEVLGWDSPLPFGEKEDRPLGMACSLPETMFFDELTAQLEQQFGGLLLLRPPRHRLLEKSIHERFPVKKVAVVGAMTDALVRAACDAGADVYVTGQFRQPARSAVEETGLGVIVLGHERSEIWGLRTLARLLREQVQNLEVVLPDPL